LVVDRFERERDRGVVDPEAMAIGGKGGSWWKK
jgi:hypothetical protein